MSEERNLRELPEARASTFKILLGVTGVVIGLGLLVCGGVAGYVAWTGPSSDSKEVLAPPAADHSKDQPAAPPIVAIDLPPGFDRIRNDMSPPVTSVTFGRKTGEGAVLVVGKVDLSSIPDNVGPEKLRGMMLREIEMADQLARTFRPIADSIDTKRELTVLGQRSSVEITHGALGASPKRVVKVAGLFSTQKARIAVVFIIPEDEYDEEAIVRMFESIQPPSGDSTPEAGLSESPPPAGASRGLGDAPAGAEPADDDKPESGRRTRPDDP